MTPQQLTNDIAKNAILKNKNKKLKPMNLVAWCAGPAKPVDSDDIVLPCGFPYNGINVTFNLNYKNGKKII